MPNVLYLYRTLSRPSILVQDVLLENLRNYQAEGNDLRGRNMTMDRAYTLATMLLQGTGTGISSSTFFVGILHEKQIYSNIFYLVVN